MGRINEDPHFAKVEAAFYVLTVCLLAYYLPILVTIFVLVPLVLKGYAKLSAGICRSYRRIDGKTVLITGANTGIGLETAKDLARRGGRIILACRNLEKGKAALEEIKRDTGSDSLVLKQLDLSSLDSVRKFCKEINSEESRLDVLINNAGIVPLLKTKELTKEKLESCMAANHFAPFLLTNLLLDLMHKTGNARIVNVSSVMHKFVRTLDSENWNFEKDFPDPWRVYCVSKLANVYFTTELNRRLHAKGIHGITVNALHPGAVRTTFVERRERTPWEKLSAVILLFFYKSAVEGAQTSIYAAVSEDLENVSGQYFSDCAIASSSTLAQDSKNARDLWEKSVKAVALKPVETIL